MGGFDPREGLKGVQEDIKRVITLVEKATSTFKCGKESTDEIRAVADEIKNISHKRQCLKDKMEKIIEKLQELYQEQLNNPSEERVKEINKELGEKIKEIKEINERINKLEGRQKI